MDKFKNKMNRPKNKKEFIQMYSFLGISTTTLFLLYKILV